MSGSIPSLNVKITAQDVSATKTLDAVGKRVARTENAAEKFGKSLSKLGDTSGIAKLSEGFHGLSSRTMDAFRSMDRMVPALGTITGAASLAGMTALVSRFGQLGQQAFLTGQRLRMPTDRLTALQGAARLAGASAEDMTSGLGSLDEKLRSATFRGDGGAIQTFNALHVTFRKNANEARNAGDAFGDVAEGLKAMYDSGDGGPRRALHAAQILGLDSLFSLLIKGRAGVQALQAESARLGSVISPEAAKRADELKGSFSRLDQAVEGIENRLGDKWGETAKKYIDGAANWIANNKAVADSYAEIGTGILALGAIRPAAWLARFLGITPILRAASPLGLLAFAGAGSDENSPENQQAFAAYNRTQARGIATNGLRSEAAAGAETRATSTWWGRHAPTWLGGAPGASPDAPRGIRNNNPLNLSYVPGQGAVATDGRFGIYGSMADGVAASERQLISYQDQGDNTLRKIITRWAPPSENDTEGYIANVSRRTGFDPNTPLNLRDPDQAQRVIGAMGRFESGREIDSRAVQAGVDQGINGNVHVQVDLKNAPPGTTASVVTSGAVTAAPPRVETAMQGLH